MIVHEGACETFYSTCDVVQDKAAGIRKGMCMEDLEILAQKTAKLDVIRRA